MEKVATARLVNWPSPQDYNEAVQNLRQNCSDSDLRNAVVEVTRLGLPSARTGAFASVYRAHAEGRDFALRCFLRDIADQEERYEKISQFVRSDSLPYTVTFDFLADGLRINGLQFPILKMDWVEGLNLDRYIEKHLGTDRIESIAASFLDMCADLREAGIAHGDLQHGNILICGEGLRLVDYDGMYIPSMVGLKSNEIGHRNYQHPRRTADDFGPHLDHFSEWVIYGSMRIIAADPSLYNLLGAGDESLLFRRDDFVEPNHSYAFALLDRHPNAQIRAISNFIRWQCARPIEEIPPLAAELPDAPILPAVVTGSQRRTPIRDRYSDGTKQLPDWLDPKDISFLAELQSSRRLSQSDPSEFESEVNSPLPRTVKFDHNAGTHPLIGMFVFLLSPSVWGMFWCFFDGAMTWLSLFCLVINYFIVRWIWAESRIHKQLATHGWPAIAEVTDAMAEKRGDAMVHTIAYRFDAGLPSGPIVVQKVVDSSEYFRLRSKRYHTVLYDPFDRHVHVLYSLSKYKPIKVEPV